MARDWMKAVVERLSRTLSVVSTTPDLRTSSATEERTLVVCWSILLAITEGEGGRGTVEAKERLVRGGRAVIRALLLVSASEVSLRTR